MSLSRTSVFAYTGALARNANRIQNRWKGGMSVMAWVKGPTNTNGCVVNIYGSSDPGNPQGTGQYGDGSPIATDDQTKQTLVVTLHPTTAGATTAVAVDSSAIVYWDYLFIEVASLEGGTNQIEVTISGRDAT